MTDAKRATVALRITPAAIAEVDKIASKQEWSRSQVIRKLLVLGLKAWNRGER